MLAAQTLAIAYIFYYKSQRINRMEGQNYSASFEVAKSPQEVFDRIVDVSKWWSKDFEGQSSKLNDEFVIDHGEPHFTRQRLIEVIPDKRIVWLVIESRLNWIEKNKHEWTKTRMIFEINSKADKTLIKFTHEGLVPEKACYERCTQGWDLVIKERLFTFICKGKAIQNLQSNK
jgi:Activator of Hsp90 ATPase homolog 1-like protein